MIYEFRAPDGSIVEANFPMSQAPDIGAEVEIEGKGKCIRILSTGEHSPQGDVRTYDHVAYNLPRNAEGAPHYNADGRPCFSSKQQVTEFAKRNGMKWD